jgi:hypothetical protein
MVDIAARAKVEGDLESPSEGAVLEAVATEGFPKVEAVAEISGEYGSFVFPERELQKLWLRREEEDRDARLEDGRRVRVL